jgi:transcriptional regulator NrdR family protein
MKCPHCGLIDHECRVVDSRPFGTTIKRRRECSYCKKRWNTFEVVQEEYISKRNKHHYIPWTDGEISTLISLYQQGFSKTEIAKRLGRTRHSVSRKLDKLTASGEYFKFLRDII